MSGQKWRGVARLALPDNRAAPVGRYAISGRAGGYDYEMRAALHNVGMNPVRTPVIPCC